MIDREAHETIPRINKVGRNCYPTGVTNIGFKRE